MTVVNFIRDVLKSLYLIYINGTKEIWAGESFWYIFTTFALCLGYFSDHTKIGLTVVFIIMPIIAFFKNFRLHREP